MCDRVLYDSSSGIGSISSSSAVHRSGLILAHVQPAGVTSLFPVLGKPPYWRVREHISRAVSHLPIASPAVVPMYVTHTHTHCCLAHGPVMDSRSVADTATRWTRGLSNSRWTRGSQCGVSTLLSPRILRRHESLVRLRGVVAQALPSPGIRLCLLLSSTDDHQMCYLLMIIRLTI